MKLSDYVAHFLADKQVGHAFVITGGASVHLIDSIAKHPDITYVCPQHEQAGAMAADAYARVTGDMGVAISTSGPGATNMITGICCAYYDSVPVLYITGQVSTFRLKRNSGVRQIGFQETDTVDICRPITKYATLLEDPLKIRYELEKAYYIAKNGRPGPVLIDIPDNLQRENIEPDELESFVSTEKTNDINKEESGQKINQCIELLKVAKRPVLILGWGIHLSGAENNALKLIEILNIPVLLTWGCLDMLPASHSLLAGTFGTHGTRYGNFAVQNADLILTIGARLDTHMTGSPLTSFAREAKKIIVDIDPSELNKFSSLGVNLDIKVLSDAGVFIDSLLTKLSIQPVKSDSDEWRKKILFWKEKYPICKPEYYEEEDVNPYVFVQMLAQKVPVDEHIFIDTGCSVAWMMQGFPVRGRQKLFHAFNNTPMGYALPASIGASFALDKKQATCVSGDGGLQMNIQELATVLHHNLPIKIFLMNNHGYSMIRQTQEQWLESRYEASAVESGLAFPDFSKVAEAYGFKTISIAKNRELFEKLQEVYNEPGPVFCNVEIDPCHRVVPQSRFGRPIEDSEPFLSRKEFLENMIVQPMEVSLI